QAGLVILPVILRACAWREVDWLARMQVRPKGGRPLTRGDENQFDQDCSELATELINIINGPLGASEVPNLSSELFPRGLRLLDFRPDRRLVIGSIDHEEIWSIRSLKRLAFFIAPALFICWLQGELIPGFIIIGLTICLWYFIHRWGQVITINI